MCESALFSVNIVAALKHNTGGKSSIAAAFLRNVAGTFTKMQGQMGLNTTCIALLPKCRADGAK